MKKGYIITLIAITIFFGLSVFFISACKCFSCQQEEAKVPDEVLQKANSYIISVTGEEFFDKYIKPDFFRTKHTAPYYEMAYRFFMPEKPYVDATITFTVDSVGNVMEDRDIIGIPRCRYFPQECDFAIDKETALQIAEGNGLEKGIKDWKVGFLWNPEMEKYVWHILSTLDEMEGEMGYRGNGKEMLIDPVTGEVLALNDWRVN